MSLNRNQWILFEMVSSTLKNFFLILKKSFAFYYFLLRTRLLVPRGVFILLQKKIWVFAHSLWAFFSLVTHQLLKSLASKSSAKLGRRQHMRRCFLKSNKCSLTLRSGDPSSSTRFLVMESEGCWVRELARGLEIHHVVNHRQTGATNDV